MENDLSGVIKIGIVVVILVFAVGLVFSILQLGKNLANKGVGQLESNIDMLSNTQFDDYDQQVVSGTKVVLSIKQFATEPIGIVITTGKCLEDGVNGGYCYGHLLDGYTSTGNAKSPAYKSSTALKRKEGSTVFTAKQAADKAICSNTKPTSISGTEQFVRPNAYFLAELIHDDTGTLIGISFTQQQQ